MRSVRVLWVLLVCCGQLHAHGRFAPEPGWRIDSNVALVHRHLKPDLNAPHVLPGSLPVSHAHEVESGWALDAAHLSLQAASQDDAYVNIEAALHSHGSGYEKEWEQVYIGRYVSGESLDWKFEFGRMKAAFRQDNLNHQQARGFSEASWIQEGLFAGQFADEGLRMQWLLPDGKSTWYAGVEAWRGETFPVGGERRKHAWDAYLRKEWHRGTWRGEAALWHFRGQALEREHGCDHNHGVGSASDCNDFSGRVAFTGAEASVYIEWTNGSTLEASVALAEGRTQGEVFDTRYLAAWWARQRFSEFGLALSQGAHRIQVRYERMWADTRLDGTGAAGIAANAAFLEHAGRTPERFSGAYRVTLNEQLAMRVSWKTANYHSDREQGVAFELLWHGALVGP